MKALSLFQTFLDIASTSDPAWELEEERSRRISFHRAKSSGAKSFSAPSFRKSLAQSMSLPRESSMPSFRAKASRALPEGISMDVNIEVTKASPRSEEPTEAKQERKFLLKLHRRSRDISADAIDKPRSNRSRRASLLRRRSSVNEDDLVREDHAPRRQRLLSSLSIRRRPSACHIDAHQQRAAQQHCEDALSSGLTDFSPEL